MKIIRADYIYIEGEYKRDYAIAFEDKIISIAPYDKIIGEYPDIRAIEKISNSVLYPGFINTHVHLEFSANRTTLKYGSFLPWLESVISDRDHLINDCDTDMMRSACNEMLSSGITTIGAISSMGLDLEAYVASPQRVVYFNELVGSNPASVDALYNDFMQRFEASSMHSDDGIIAAIAIHSPYALHPIVLKKAIKFAKENGIRLSAHFLESSAEREWLESGDGDFKPFFNSIFKQQKPTMGIDEFLGKFDGYPTHFTHCVHAKEKELSKMAQEGHTIAHCPKSNRLLGCGKLDIERVGEFDIPYTIATDGLSSNNKLNILDELRAAIMIHQDIDINTLAKDLIRSITKDAGRVLDLNIGEIREGYQADFAIIKLPEAPKQESDIALWTILHTDRAEEVYIGGERVAI